MAPFTGDSKVLIIGSGPGGLALAQILRRHGIAFEIFERDEKIIPRRQGWSVGLIEALTETTPLFPEDMGDIRSVSVNSNIMVDDAMTIVNPNSAGKMAVLGGRPVGQPGHLIRGDRQRLREYLSQGLNVQIGKSFSHYEEDAWGVTAFFSDDSSVRGTLLVGADGAHSKVRRQLLGTESAAASVPEPSRWIPIFGECGLSREQYEPYHNLSSAGILSGAEKLRYMIAPKEISPDRSTAQFYWAACFQTSSPEESAEWLQFANQQELYDKAIEVTRPLAPFLTNIITYTGPKGMICQGPRFVEYVSPDSLPSGRVTLLGDAAHTMLPFRGAGANTAMRDAANLAQLLVQNAQHGGSEAEAILQDYSKIMLPRGQREVLASRASADTPMGVLGAMKDRIDTSKDSGMPLAPGNVV